MKPTWWTRPLASAAASMARASATFIAERFLAQHVLAVSEREQGLLTVKNVRRDDGHGIDVGAGAQLAIVGVHVGHVKPVGHRARRRRGAAAQRHHLGVGM